MTRIHPITRQPLEARVIENNMRITSTLTAGLPPSRRHLTLRPTSIMLLVGLGFFLGVIW